MNRVEALAELPEVYAEALHLSDQGLEHEIPGRLGIPTQAVPTLLRLAEAKLDRFLARSDRDTEK